MQAAAKKRTSPAQGNGAPSWSDVDPEVRRTLASLRRLLTDARAAMMDADEHELRSRVPENRATMVALLDEQKRSSETLLRHALAFGEQIIAALPEEEPEDRFQSPQ